MTNYRIEHGVEQGWPRYYMDNVEVDAETYEAAVAAEAEPVFIETRLYAPPDPIAWDR